jgi:hypothetical protein
VSSMAMSTGGRNRSDSFRSDGGLYPVILAFLSEPFGLL